ncbi:glycoside hydrolase family 3 N-terminal domain-containing protein [Pseudactinotalea sp. Z1739]|uniref:glycoside hydrolase family 3 N-terminal domain-containing protein n=1 Tax=Pseudactinotalea sp. Z1739 TaxID=3413028 RepID=UPI003C7A2E13
MSPEGDQLCRDIHGVLLPGFNGATPPPWLWAAAEQGLAGVLLFGHNTGSPEHTAEITAQLHHRAPDLIISSDEEGGDVTRVQTGTGSFLPGACALGEVDDVALTHRAAVAQGRLMRAAGVDLPLTPVLDVASQPANPVIGVRSFGPDPHLVARHGVATVRGLQEAGVAACAKHFPGHGDTDVDSHLALPRLEVGEELLRGRDLPPFTEAISAGLDTVMTGHLVVPALGELPASLEPKVAALLRRLGHSGPIVTDALDMAALHADTGAGPGTTAAELVGIAAVRALAGGADLLCLGSTPDRDDAALFQTVYAGIRRAVQEGRLDAAALARSAVRNRALAAGLRSRQARTEAPDLLTALTDLEHVGARVAAAAVRTTGQVRLSRDDALVDLRAGVNIAAGPRAGAVVDLLTARAGLVPVAAAELPSWLADHPGKGVALLTRGPTDAVAPVLARAPHAVVVHLGVPGAAPQAPNLVLAHGSALANGREILARTTG